MKEPVRFQTILGVRFIVGDEQDAIDEISREGGLVVVPAAPALKNLPHDHDYREALLGADFAIADSAMMVLMWNILESNPVRKLSGLRYLRALIRQPELRADGSSFWVMPTTGSIHRLIDWLNGIGVQLTEKNCYSAPFYGRPIEADELVELLERKRPQHIILGLGGGTQERLGFFLKQKLRYRPAIHCVGAAIGFLSGDQVHIPAWADSAGIGWLFRCLSDPKVYGPRYWSARHLAPLMLRYREELPAEITPQV